MSVIANIFYHTGKASARRPVTSIFIGLILTLIGCLGFINYRATVSILQSPNFIIAPHFH